MDSSPLWIMTTSLRHFIDRLRWVVFWPRRRARFANDCVAHSVGPRQPRASQVEPSDTVDNVDLTNYLKIMLEHTSADLHHWAEAVVEAPSIP
jgi:hypothetical protein